MILQALQEYYDRKTKVPNSSVAPLGWELKEIPYIVALDTEGNPRDVTCSIEGSGKKKTIKKFYVPQAVKRASNVVANLLWDNPEYVFGLSIKKKDDPKSVKKQAAFRQKIEELGTTDDPGIVALKKFLDFTIEEKIEKLDALNNENWETLKKDSAVNVTFKLFGEQSIIADTPGFKELYERSKATSTGEIIRCLVSGEQDVLERLHPSIKGVRGGNPTGTSIVSFNLAPYSSYGKGQGANAPVGKKAAFAYTTALNMLLAKESQNCLFIGDVSIVFWSEKKCNLENKIIPIFAEPPKDDPDKNVGKVKELYNSVNKGAEVESDETNRFYILGLSPNSARLAIRFWINSTVKDISDNIERYFQETDITHRDIYPKHLPVIRLLKSIAVQGKSENIPSNLEGDLMRAILEGLDYPQTLLSAVVQRIRAERLPANYEASYARAALLKAFFNRKEYLAGDSTKKTSKEDLDKKTHNQKINYQEFEAFEMNPKDNEKHTELGFLLGRLFATLEKIQSEANPNIKATIRDRFYGAASGTPVVVFPNLLRLKNHHLSKLDNEGRKINFERLLCDILSKVDCFPANLSLEQQGLFALGYYYQMQDFYTKKSDKEEIKQEAE